MKDLGTSIAGKFVSSFSAANLQKDLLSQTITTALALALPKNILNDPAAIKQLQAYMVGQLNKTLNEKVNLLRDFSDL